MIWHWRQAAIRTTTRLVLALLTLSGAAFAEVRVALVIGISDYEAVGKLANPAKDARAVGAALSEAGFTVTPAFDLNLTAFRDTLYAFEERARQADVALIYFAGHGIEIGGINYMVPRDARLKRPDDATYQTVPLAALRAATAGAKRLRITILDACRDNPFLANMVVPDKSVVSQRGLSAIRDLGAAELIAYAAAAGKTASDGAGDSSPFARAFIDRLKKPEVDVRFLFGGVYKDVVAMTGKDGIPSQEPEIYMPKFSDELAPLVKSGDAVKPQDATPAPAEDRAKRDFEVAKSLGSVAAWDEFLKQHPDGLYAAAAREEKGKLAAVVPVPAPAPAPAPAPVVIEPEKKPGTVLNLPLKPTEGGARPGRPLDPTKDYLPGIGDPSGSKSSKGKTAPQAPLDPMKPSMPGLIDVPDLSDASSAKPKTEGQGADKEVIKPLSLREVLKSKPQQQNSGFVPIDIGKSILDPSEAAKGNASSEPGKTFLASLRPAYAEALKEIDVVTDAVVRRLPKLVVPDMDYPIEDQDFASLRELYRIQTADIDLNRLVGSWDCRMLQFDRKKTKYFTKPGKCVVTRDSGPGLGFALSTGAGRLSGRIVDTGDGKAGFSGVLIVGDAKSAVSGGSLRTEAAGYLYELTSGAVRIDLVRVENGAAKLATIVEMMPR